MKISFSGIKNLSSSCALNYPPTKKEMKSGAKEMRTDIHMKLDNEGTNDLDVYQKLLGKKLVKKDGIIDLTTSHYNYGVDRYSGLDREFTICLINGEVLEETAKNREKFKGLCDLTDKISQIQPKEFSVDPNFKTSKEFKDSFSYFQIAYVDKIVDKNQFEEKINKTLTPETNKICATLMKSNLIRAMIDARTTERI